MSVQLEKWSAGKERMHDLMGCEGKRAELTNPRTAFIQGSGVTKPGCDDGFSAEGNKENEERNSRTIEAPLRLTLQARIPLSIKPCLRFLC